MSEFLEQPDAVICLQLMFLVGKEIGWNVKVTEDIYIITLTALRLSCKRLNSIILNCSDILDFLRNNLLKLRKTWFGSLLVTDEYLNPLLHENVMKLDLRTSPYITNKGLQYIAQKCPNLVCILLDRSSNNLRINYGSKELTKLTDHGIDDLITGCKKLTQIDIGWCTSLTSRASISIASSSFAANIISLDLQATHVDQKAIDLIGMNCKSLTYLHLKDALMDDVSALSNCHNMETLHLCRTYLKPLSVLDAVKGFATSIRYLCVMGVRSFDTDTAVSIAALTKDNIKTWACLRGTMVSTDGSEAVVLRELRDNNVVLDDPH